MIHPATRFIAALAVAVISLAVSPEIAGAQDARASLAAELDFFDPETRRPVRPEAGTAIGLRVSLTDVTTGRAPRGLTVAGWVRSKAQENASCEEAAQAFRVTAQPPVGSVDLNGILLVSLNEDASVGVIDPKLNLQSSNMIAAANLDGPPSAMAVDVRSFRALFVNAEGAGISSLSLLTGALKQHFKRQPPLSDVVGGGERGIWVGRVDGHIFPFGDPDALRRVGDGAVTFRKSSEPDSPLLAAFADQGGLLVFDGATGRTVFDVPQFEPLSDLALLWDGSAITVPVSGRVVRIVYPDAPGHSIDVPLGFKAGRVVASPDGRHAIAYSPGGSAAVVIDVARAEVVQPLELIDSTLAEVTFTDDAAYLLSLDGGFAGLIDLSSVSLGRGAQIRKIDLARKSAQPRSTEGLLVPLWPSPQVLAVSPETQTGWLLHDDQAVGEMPPMDSVRLRGGVPSRVAVIDRSFRETGPGVFETVALVPGGDHELVLTTGIGGMTACLDFRVSGPADTQQADLATLSVDAGQGHVPAGKDVEIELAFHDSSGNPIAVDRVEFLVPSLSSSWIGRMTALRAPDGKLRGRVRFPHPGPYALQPLALPENLHLKSAVLLEVSS